MKGSVDVKNYMILYDEIMAQKNITNTEKIIICDIIDLNSRGIFYPSTEYLAKHGKIQKRSCTNMLSKLKKRGYISIKKEYVKEQCTELRSIKITEKTFRLIKDQLNQLIEAGEIDEYTKSNLYAII